MMALPPEVTVRTYLGNRSNILNSEYRYVGVSANRQLKNEFKTVIVYATIVGSTKQEQTKAACECRMI